MRQTELFSKTTKLVAKEEVSLNAQLLTRAGYIDKLMAGVYSILPLGLRVLNKIEKIVREEMNAVGGQELYLPTLHPKENWLKTKRWDELDVLFKLKLAGNKELALGPTHEEVISPLAKKFISSYKDLPKAVYQFQNKFRNEPRAKSGILRGREFIMKDLYSFHADEEDLDKYYIEVQKAYEKIFKRAGIGEVTFLTYASGGTFSKYSHEFQALTQAGEDTIYICDKCGIAVNQEIIDDLKRTCPQCGSKNLRKEIAAEVGNIFTLKTKFSKPFNLSYIDKQGQEKPVIMGCYGLGLQRLMGTIVEVSNDKNGIIWPDSVAPFRVHLVELASANDVVKKTALDIYDYLKEQSIEVLYDDRLDKKPGEKLVDADLLGIPLRVIVSDKSLKENKFEIKKRSETEAKLISRKELLKMVA